MKKTNGVLKDKVALITGSASGIGRATALLFARGGAALTLVDVTDAAAQTVVRTITGEGGRAIFVAGDVSQAADCQRAVARSVFEGGRSTSSLTMRASSAVRPCWTRVKAEWDRMMAVNLKAIFLLSKYAIPEMIKAGGGVAG